METLFNELNKVLKSKNEQIDVLKWECEMLSKENARLKEDIEKYKENEVKRV